MFDIGFWELVVIAIIALFVLGPERLPKFAHDLGHLTRKINRYIKIAKYELGKELSLDESDELNAEIRHLDQLFKNAPDKPIISKKESGRRST